MIHTALFWSLLGYLSIGLLTFTVLLVRSYFRHNSESRTVWKFLRESVHWRKERNDILIVIFAWPYAWFVLYTDARADRERRRRLEGQREARRLESERQNAALPEYRPYYQPAPPAPSVPAQPVRAPRKMRKAVLRRQSDRQRPW